MPRREKRLKEKSTKQRNITVSDWLNFLLHERDFTYEKRKRYSFSRFLIIFTPYLVILLSIIIGTSIAKGYTDHGPMGIVVMMVGGTYIFVFLGLYWRRIQVSEANEELSLGISKIIKNIIINPPKNTEEIEKEYLFS